MTKSTIFLLILLIFTFCFTLLAEDARDTTAVTIWKRDPCFSSTLFSPTAHTIPQGTGNVKDILLVWPTISYSFFDGLQGSVSFIVPFLFEESVVSPAIKAELFCSKNDEIVFSVQGDYTRFASSGKQSDVWSGHIIASLHPNERMGIHFRWGNSYDEKRDKLDNVYSLGADYVILDYSKLLFEYVKFVGDEDGRLYTWWFFGVRFFDETTSGDIGFAPYRELFSGEFSLLPFASFSYTF